MTKLRKKSFHTSFKPRFFSQIFLCRKHDKKFRARLLHEKKVAVPDPDLLTAASRYFSESPSKRDSCGFHSFRMICIEELKLTLNV